jgi:hypothetical protein
LNRLFNFSSVLFRHTEKPKQLKKGENACPLGKTRADSLRNGTKVDHGWTKIELNELYPMDDLVFSQHPSNIEKKEILQEKRRKLLKIPSRFA